MAKKLLFIDRDGTLIMEPRAKGGNIDKWEKLEFFPHVFYYLRLIATELDYELVIVSNQDGLGSPSFPYSHFQPIQDFMMKTFEGEDIHFSAVYFDPSFKQEKSPNRKPRIGLIKHYLDDANYDVPNSLVIGDRITDVQLAKNMGCKCIWIHRNEGLGMKEITDSVEDLRATALALETTGWKEIYEYLKRINA